MLQSRSSVRSNSRILVFSSCILKYIQVYLILFLDVALPEDILRRFKTLGYQWLVRAFGMVQKDIPQFTASLYAKFYP